MLRIDMSGSPERVAGDGQVRVGDVYGVYGGRGGGGRFRIVVAVVPANSPFQTEYATSLIVDSAGEIVGSDKCATHYLGAKPLLGTCDLGPLSLIKVEWL